MSAIIFLRSGDPRAIKTSSTKPDGTASLSIEFGAAGQVAPLFLLTTALLLS